MSDHLNPLVVVIGAPNSGKTTLFNWLTGSHYKSVNYPGSTVDYTVGQSLANYGRAIRFMDTPGTYSLQPKSPEEKVTLEALLGQSPEGSPASAVVVVDGTQMSRQLLIAQQLRQLQIPFVVALTMSDLIHRQGEVVDIHLLETLLGTRCTLINGQLGGGVKELIQSISLTPQETKSTSWRDGLQAFNLESTDKMIRLSRDIESQVLKVHPQSTLRDPKLKAEEKSLRLDRVLLHPVWGLLLFLTAMTALFTSIFWLAKPVMDLVDWAFGTLAELTLSLGPNTLWADFLSNGIVSSLGSVLIFVPQIFILSFGIFLLEDSGYLARAATLVDRPLSWFGLNGKSFVPLLSAHACAVPAMLASRNIPGRKERWLTLFIIPLMTCSARLPVYALLLMFLFHDAPAWQPGIALAGIYFAALAMGAIASAMLSRLLTDVEKSFFLLELPFYRRPHLRTIARLSLNRTVAYIKRAGPVIWVLALLIWCGTTLPNWEMQDRTERLQTSYAGQLGQWIEPVMRPMGGDWRVGVGLISAFAAREVFVSSLAIVFNVSDGDEDKLSESLVKRMSEAKNIDDLPLFTTASVLGLIVYFMFALQCIATTGTMWKESASWRLATLQTVIFNLVGYGAAVFVVKGLRAFGIN